MQCTYNLQSYYTSTYSSIQLIYHTTICAFQLKVMLARSVAQVRVGLQGQQRLLDGLALETRSHGFETEISSFGQSRAWGTMQASRA